MHHNKNILWTSQALYYFFLPKNMMHFLDEIVELLRAFKKVPFAGIIRFISIPDIRYCF